MYLNGILVKIAWTWVEWLSFIRMLWLKFKYDRLQAVNSISGFYQKAYMLKILMITFSFFLWVKN